MSRRVTGLASSSELLKVRDYFYGRLEGRFPKHHIFVANSVGFVMDMMKEDGVSFEVIKILINQSEKLMLLLFLRYMENFKKVLVMGKDNRFILS